MGSSDDNSILEVGKMENINLNNELLIKTIINYSSDTIYFKDRESRFILIGRSQAERFGLEDPKEAIGKSDFDFFPEDQAGIALEDERRILATGSPILSKTEYIKWPTGKCSWMTASKYPLYDLQGNIIGTWGSLQRYNTTKAGRGRARKGEQSIEGS
jgi:PAS domain S-box-containing protein